MRTVLRIFRRRGIRPGKAGYPLKSLGKSLVWFLLTASIPGFITGAFIYGFAVLHMERDLSRLHQNQMEERIRNIDDQLAYLEMDLSHWAFTPRFGFELLDLDFVYHFQETWDISTSLVIMEGSHPLIRDAALYVDRSEPVVFKPGYFRVENAKEREAYRNLLNDPRQVYWTGGEAAGSPLRLVHKIPGDSTRPFGLLAVALEDDKIVNLLKTMTPYNEGTTFLLGEDGGLIVADKPGEAIVAQLQSEVLAKGKPEGTFLWESGEQTYSVSYGPLRRIDKTWTYVSAAPLTAVTAPVIALSNLILLVSSAGLLLAIALSWWNWSRTMNERLGLQQRIDEQLPSLRTGFLLQLLRGHLRHYTENDLKERMSRYGWQVEGRRFYVLRAQLTGSGDLAGKFPPGSDSLVTFAASNIIEELAAERFADYGVINFQDLSVAALIIVPADEPVSGRLRSFGEEVTKVINRILHLHVVITISRPADSVRRLSEMFAEVERAAGFRKFSDRNQILPMEEQPLEPAGNESHYPFELEMELIGALRGGKKGEASALLARFVEEVMSRHGTEIHLQQSMLQLFAGIRHMMLETGIDPYRLFDDVNMFRRLSEIRDPDNMIRWMKERVIGPYMQEREERADRQMKRIVDETVAYIRNNYMNDLSLDRCAERAGLTPYALSRLFKQHTGVNFIDFLTDLRIEQAKRLLRDSDLQIQDIARAVGYQHRYFNRIFKKQVGVTPGQFRTLSG